MTRILRKCSKSLYKYIRKIVLVVLDVLVEIYTVYKKS